MTPLEFLNSQGFYMISGRQSNPDGSVTSIKNNQLQSPGDVTPAPSQSDAQSAIASQYGLGDLFKYAGGSYSQLTDWLSRSDVPEDRKRALVSSLTGMISSLPEHSGLDLLSEQVIGTSNYQRSMQTLSGQIGEAIGNAINGNYEEGYNSAVEQAARERAAGVNPDLSGIDPGQASDTNEMASPYSGLGTPDVSSDFFSTGLTAIQLVTGFVGQVQGWISNDITNATAEVGLDNALRENIRVALSSIAPTQDDLDSATIQYVKDRYKEYEGSRLDSIASRDDLNSWISDYNKRNPQSPVSLSELYSSAVLKAAKKANNPYSSLRARRSYERAINSISLDSPYIKSYIKSLENQASGSELSDIKNKIQIQEFLGPLGDAYRASFKIIQDAENEINTYNRKYYHERNGLVPVDDGNGGVSYEDFIGLEAEAEANEFSASKMSSIATKYRDKLKAELRKTFDGYLSQIRESQGEDSIAYSVASILFPCLQMFMENQAGQSIGALISRPRPAPVNIEKTQNIGSITNNNGL